MGDEMMLEDEQELEDLDQESDWDEDAESEEEMEVPDTETDRDVEDDEELELEDLDDEAGQEAEVQPEAETGMPETENGEAETGKAQAGGLSGFYERSIGKGAAFVDNLKGKADSTLDQLLPKAEALINQHKGRFFKAYDTVMDLKDEMHYASKESGGGFNGFKSAAGVLGKHIKESNTYKKMMDTKVGRWIQEKRANRSDEPGVMGKAWNKVKTGAGALAGKAKKGASIAKDTIKSGVSKAGSTIKSGASYLGNVVKNSASRAMDQFNGTRLGKWIQEKRADKSEEPGVIGKAWDKVKTGARALTNKVKKGAAWIGEQKEWANQKLGALKAWKQVHIDERLDNHEHERRVRFMERQGDSGYGQRYNDLVGEMKALPGIDRLKGLVGKEIEEVFLELEQGKDAVEEKVGAAAARGEDMANKAGRLLNKGFIKDKARDHFGGIVDHVSGGLGYGKDALHAVKSGAGIVSAQRLKKDLSGMEKKTSDKTLSKGIRFAKKKADKETVNTAFDIVKTGVTTTGRIFKQKTAAKVVNKLVDLAEGAVTSGMDKETRKDSLKGILGGVEGYRQLKEKYKLKAPEMRRAIRQAIGVSSEDDVVNMDRLTTSQDIMRNAREGDQDSRDFAKRVKASNSNSMYAALGGGDTIFRTQNYAAQEA